VNDNTNDSARHKANDHDDARRERGQAQPEPEASSDGDQSWTADPITADPNEDRSVDAVIKRGSHH
jgi:hypothetical protein